MTIARVGHGVKVGPVEPAAKVGLLDTGMLEPDPLNPLQRSDPLNPRCFTSPAAVSMTLTRTTTGKLNRLSYQKIFRLIDEIIENNQINLLNY